MLKLVISDNEGTTTVVPFVRDEISIGRKDGNTIRLTERNISRRHCTFERVNGAYRVRDHGSYNGVVVNGAKIDGELAIKPGDHLQIGDYTLLVEAETNAVEPPTTELPKSMPPPPAPRARSSEEPSETEPTRVAPLPKAPASPTPPKALSPSRLVVLTPPLAGAEFSLPDRGELRIGRAEELEITIDHRSVSREHARLTCEGGRYRLTDRGSSNGVLVNGERVTDDELSNGDVIELGEVLVRFVAAGEAYVFDPNDVKELLRRKRRGSRGALLIAGAIVGAALVLAVVIVNGSRDEDEAGAAVASATGVVATSDGPEVSEDQRFGELLGACRAALSGGRFAESMAHAQQALKLRPASSEAASCHTQARAQHEQEQAFVRAKAAYEGGDLGAAQKEIELLTPGTPLASRPDVLALVQSVGEARVAEAEMLSARDHGKAVELAQGVLRVPMLSPAHRQRADAVVASAGSEPAAPAVSSAPAARGARPPKDRERAPDRASALPKAPAGSEKPPIEVASACLARGDNACVVRALQGKAQSAQELGLLIETYRAMGNTAQAHKHMAMYVQRFPTARRAETYRIMLERANP